MGIAAVNQWRSQKAYEEVRNHWLPQLTVGSGLGYSYGLSAHSRRFCAIGRQFHFDTNRIQSFSEAVPESGEDRLESHFLRCAGQARRGDSRCRPVLRATGRPHRANSRPSPTRRPPPTRPNTSPNSGSRKASTAKLEVTRSQLAAARIRLRIADAQGQTGCPARAPCETDWTNARRRPTRSGIHAATALSFPRKTTSQRGPSPTVRSSSWPTRKSKPPPLVLRASIAPRCPTPTSPRSTHTWRGSTTTTSTS